MNRPERSTTRACTEGRAASRERALATFRFYEELNDFLPRERRGHAFDYLCARAATVKNAIEALGVPHTEAELILVNGESVDFAYLVQSGDYVSVYPVFETFDITPLLRLRERPPRHTRFVADAHLGGLARGLRMLGFDTVFRNDLTDGEIRAISHRDGRIVLSRDRELLKRRGISHGCYVHALRPLEQLREVAERLQLAASAQPFTLCLHCNLALRPIGKEAIQDRLPPKVAAAYPRFHWCEGCDRVYWEGSHWRHMSEVLPGIVAS